jgi:hypothetical protein
VCVCVCACDALIDIKCVGGVAVIN